MLRSFSIAPKIAWRLVHGHGHCFVYEGTRMRVLARLLTLALVVAAVSCSGGGSTVPVVQDYTSSAPPVHAKPQSVIPPPLPCAGPTCGGGRCDTASPSAPQSEVAESGMQVKEISTWKRPASDCVAAGGYDYSEEQQCNSNGGDYLSLQSGVVTCAINGNSVSINNPFNCPFSVVLNAPSAIEYATFSIIYAGPPITVNNGSMLGYGGIRVGYDCEIVISAPLVND